MMVDERDENTPRYRNLGGRDVMLIHDFDIESRSLRTIQDMFPVFNFLGLPRSLQIAKVRGHLSRSTVYPVTLRYADLRHEE